MKRHVCIFAFLIASAALFLGLMQLMKTDPGTLLRESDFITFDDTLYAPEELPDFSQGHSGQAHDYWGDEPFTRIRTSVMDVELEEGRVYGLHGENLTYAARVWVNGALLVDQGRVAESAADFIPHTASFTVYFTAGAQNRIVVQRCNFDHAKWNLFEMYLGPQQVITRSVHMTHLKSAALLMFLLTIGLINLGMFAGLPDRRRFLWFALSCFCLTLYHSFDNPKLIMLLLPDLSWPLAHKLETCSLILGAAFLLLFFQACFGYAGKVFRRVGYGLIVLVLGYYIFLPARIYTRYAVPVSNAVALYAVAFCLLFIFRAVRNRKQISVSQRYYLSGIAIVALGGGLGALRVGPYMDLLQIAVILFQIVLTLGLAVEFQTVRHAYEQSSQREAELRRMNEAMERTQALQENFLSIMNHEMRTPLTVIAGYADKVAVQTKDESSLRALRLVKQEALRLGRIVEQSEEGAVRLVSAKMEPIELATLLRDARAFCLPICEKRSNTLTLQCPEDLCIHGVRDSLLQALYNLIINASRHTQGGRILLSAQRRGAETVLSVRDSGDGMDEETLRHAFDKGYTKDGGHGLGLNLCREIAEDHGGRIWIERNNPERGITVSLALPDAE